MDGHPRHTCGVTEPGVPGVSLIFLSAVATGGIVNQLSSIIAPGVGVKQRMGHITQRVRAVALTRTG